MCTLIVLHGCVPGAPLIVAANRDEFFERQSEGPSLRWLPTGAIVAPRDVQAGGTWLGVNDAGLFAAVTNRLCEELDPSRRSRGMLVLDALASETASRAADRAQDLARGAYNPFNLFVADRRSAHVVSYVDSPERVDLGPGVHVVGNVDPAERTPKTARLRERAEAAAEAAGPTAALECLASICRSHDGGGDPLRDACVHAGRYGTRSSALLSLADADDGDVLRFADGAPCATEYEDFTPLLRRLDRSLRPDAGESGMRKVS